MIFKLRQAVTRFTCAFAAACSDAAASNRARAGCAMSGFDNYLITGALVAIYGWTRFNTPKTNRASTTLAQFYLTGFAYVASCLVLYLLVARLIADNRPALSSDAIKKGGFSYVRPPHDHHRGHRPG